MNLSLFKSELSLKTYQKYLLILFGLLTLKAVWAFYEISTGYINLDPDEAQYWTWSQNLDFGFYSKPPGIAWQIWLGCKIFGNTELGVRSMAVLISLLTTLTIFWGAIRAQFGEKAAFWSALIFSFSPIGMMGTFAATTDGGFILFWCLALIPFFEALIKEESPNYLLISLFILCGALFKWTIFLLWIPMTLTVLIYRFLYNKGLFSGVALSFAGLLPSIVWNSTHNWATFKHVATQTTTTASKGNFLEFFGAQFAVLSPIFFVMLLLALLEVLKLRKKVSKPLIFCSITTTLILLTYLFLSTFKKIQANWAIFAYPTATFLIAWYGLEKAKKGMQWLYRGVALSLFMVFVLVSIPFVQKHSPLSEKWVPFKINPFRRSVGWHQLQQALSSIEYDPQTHFLFADTYQLSSLLSFYSPAPSRQYFLNTDHRRQNQFCFWPSMADERVGQTGFYVWTKSCPDFLSAAQREVEIATQKLSKYFDHIELVQTVPLFTIHGTVVKGALIFKCTKYNGEEPGASRDY